MSNKAKDIIQKQQQTPVSESGFIQETTTEHPYPCLHIPAIKGRRHKHIFINEISHIFVNTKTVYFVGPDKSELFTMNNTTLKKIKEYICTQELSHLFIDTSNYLFPMHIFSSLFKSGDFSNQTIKKILNKNGISTTKHLILNLKKHLISIGRHKQKCPFEDTLDPILSV